MGKDLVINNDADKILALAIEQGAPLEQLEKWLSLKRDHERSEARKSFFKAFTLFKQEKIQIKKDKVNNAYNSQYTSLGLLLETINPVLGKHGLYLSFNVAQAEKTLTVEAIVRHKDGHSESVKFTGPIDGPGPSNQIHKIKSTFTYLRSAAVEAITGLAGTEASLDDDGNGAFEEKFISGVQQSKIAKLIKDTDSDLKKFLGFVGARALDEIQESKYNKAVAALKRKATTAKEKKCDADSSSAQNKEATNGSN